MGTGHLLSHLIQLTIIKDYMLECSYLYTKEQSLIRSCKHIEIDQNSSVQRSTHHPLFTTKGASFTPHV